MKNVLFVGPYRQTDGWGIASRSYIKSLVMTGNNLYTRPIYYGDENIKVAKYSDGDILEQKIDKKIDVVIQHCLPNSFVRHYGVKNVGLCFFESHNLGYSTWIDNINLLDELWVCSSYEKNALIESNVKIPIIVMQIPRPLEQYKQNFGKIKSLDKHAHEFKFYFIGEHTTRKNIHDIIVAFHSEFIFNEDVRLLIKTNDKNIHKTIHSIKSQLGIYDNIQEYRKEIVFTNRLSNEEINAIHSSCDCFISAAYGEAFSLPAFDALGFGKTPIVNKNTGMSEFVTDYNGFLVNSFEVPAIDKNRPIGDLYKTTDSWFKIDVIHLRQKMREAFEMSIMDKNEKKRRGIVDVQKFSYENIAQKMVDAI